MAKGKAHYHRTNEQIRLPQVRLIDENNEQLGIVDTSEALARARRVGLDLVEVAPKERPPVCRIMDYGKFKYEQKKRSKKSSEQLLKEVRMRPKTDDNDRAIKLNRALKFLAKGAKVQLTMQFRGRERARREVGVVIFRQIIEELGDLVKVERPPSMDGRHMITILAPNKRAFEKLEKDGFKPTLEDVHARNQQLAAAEEAARQAAGKAPTPPPATAARPPTAPPAAAPEPPAPPLVNPAGEDA